jgi:antitoxin component of MazEF toxin-antitoxin module
MKTNLIRMGNSRGIRIPKPLIEECQLGETVELRIEDNRLVISAKSSPRAGRSMAGRTGSQSRQRNSEDPAMSRHLTRRDEPTPDDNNRRADDHDRAPVSHACRGNVSRKERPGSARPASSRRSPAPGEKTWNRVGKDRSVGFERTRTCSLVPRAEV